MTLNTSVEISVVIPVFNERDNVRPLVSEINASLEPLQRRFEIILADDCSIDGTWEEAEKLEQELPCVRSARLKEHGGQSAAMLLGLREAHGSILVTMDGDLQNDPRDIPRLLERLDKCDVVCGYRAKRRDSWSRRLGSRIANRVRNLVTRDGIIDTGCSLKAFRKECADDLPALRGVHRFMPAYFRLHGRKMEQIPVNHRAREHGRSKYTNLKRLPTTLLDLFGFWWYRRRIL